MANPFDSDDDEYMSRDRNRKDGLGLEPVKGYSLKSSNNIEDEVANIEREMEKYMQMSLDSTQRSCQQLDSSEQLAQQTGAELLRQREQLERADKNLDQIHETTQYTQRSLNSLKSLFGGMFKNKFSRLPKEKSKEESQQKEQNAIMGTSKSADHISKILDNNVGENSTSSTGQKPQHSLNTSSRAQIKGTRWETMDNQIDQNLDQMSSQLAHLRTWGTTLGNEVDDQNKLLDRIQSKAERNDSVVRNQENQMRKLLG